MLGVVFYSPAINGQGAVHVKSIAAKHAIRDGMGAGEFSGSDSDTSRFGTLSVSLTLESITIADSTATSGPSSMSSAPCT